MPELILAIETSGPRFSVALCRDGIPLLQFISPEDLMHESALASTIHRLLEGNKTAVTELAAMAVGSGPGSYSGLRIGMALASGFSMAAGIPLVPVGTLENMLVQLQMVHPEADFFVVMMKARLQECFIGIWARDQKSPLQAPQWMSNEQAGILLAGLPAFNLLVTNSEVLTNDAALNTKGNIKMELVSPDAISVGRLAHKMLPEILQSGDPDSAEPLYLKPVYLSIPNRG